MGSQKIQGELWGKRPKDWASIQEPTGNSGYQHALHHLKIKSGQTLLDVGCGTGYFGDLAFRQGAEVTGIDASEELIKQAKRRNPAIEFSSGEMEELPFSDCTFDFVCGFNSYQYAVNIKNALSEARRVLKDKGKLAVMIWGNKGDCEALTYLKAIGSLLPPPPPGAAGPFALSEDRLLERTLEEVGFKVIAIDDVHAIWDYPNRKTALKGLLSAGPVAKAIDNSSFEKVYEAVLEDIQPYIQKDGSVIYKNKYRVVICEK
ncbi:MAG: methyltransferase domain-containing protein [Cyclobacteriaceae bacterium]